MIPYNMRAVGNDDGRGWTRLSGNDMTNLNKPKEQTSRPSCRYTAPNHFATSNYDMYTSPVTASVGSRRSVLSSYALPSPLPSTVEMQDLGTPSTSRQDPPAPGTLPTPATQPNNPRRSLFMGPWSATLLWMALFIIAMGLHPLHFTPEPWSWTGWARPGQHELLSVKQVIFATVPKKAIWGL
ncbi:unnamed protein product [Aureobasidium vineae]|uniref:Uncharacterized protein n=1 Tax=Aureobasidium vineae TaxID=2773715 RepID=A0A9N8P688_9PEZI|nr:unnamed protein product [Aureobasidium vineae]